MYIDILKRIGLLLLLFVVQALVLNHIHLLGCATPLLFVYFVISFRRGYPRWAVLLWCFVFGLLLDTFTNTPGLAASSLTAMGLLQPYILEPFIPRDSTEDLKPSSHTLGPKNYFVYSFVCVLLFALIFFSVEAFSFFNWQQWLLNIGGSTLLTMILILAIESVRSK